MGASPAHAGQLSDTIEVTATIEATCTLFLADNVAFGTYDPLAATPTTSAFAIAMDCTAGLPYSLTLDQGLNSAAGTCLSPERRLSDGLGHHLNYTLEYTFTPGVDIGCSSDNDYAYVGTGGLNARSFTGRILPGQIQDAGSYTDTVVATISF